MASSIIQKSLQGDLNTLSARAGWKYRNESESGPYSFTTLNGYGALLVITQYDLWFVHYDGNGTHVYNVTNKDTAHGITATYNPNTRGMVISPVSGVSIWGGITVYQ